MRIIIAPDSFKGTMTAPQAAAAIKMGILQVMPEAQVLTMPVGDGGEGTVNAIASSLSGAESIVCHTVDPLQRPIEAQYVISGSTAYIESASASGLCLVEPEERDIIMADTRGTGILIADAFKRGIHKFVICMGGTATCDGGAGCLCAMREAGVKNIEISLLCDVVNPLCGPDGAAVVFSPQKGAAETDIPALEKRLWTLAEEYRLIAGMDIRGMKYAGAAGGLAGMLMACYGATAMSGIQKVLEIMEFEKRLRNTDWVITGEGKADITTLEGKAAKGILDMSKKQDVPVAIIGGSVSNRDLLLNAGFALVVQATPAKPEPTVKPSEYLSRAARTLAEEIF